MSAGAAGQPVRAGLGVILAGGASRRMPGGKAGALLAGRPLLDHMVAAVRGADLTPIVVARAGTELPACAAQRWDEPPTPDGAPHPLRGIAWALEQAGEPIVVVPVDLPLLPAAVLSGLASSPGNAVLATGGRPAALVARLEPELAPALGAAADAGARALGTLVDLGAALVELSTLTRVEAAQALLNVNDPAALARAQALANPGRRHPHGLSP